MVRLANMEDAEQLENLNNAFNGAGETSLEHIRKSIENNRQEVIIAAEEDHMLVAFLCVQLKKSFCYDDFMPELTELYVEPEYRRRGIATDMMTFAVKYCKENFPCHKMELLTGEDNLEAQKAYGKFGFLDDGEMHLSKEI